MRCWLQASARWRSRSAPPSALTPRARGAARGGGTAVLAVQCAVHGGMIGLACAPDLILLFVFFDLTAVAWYFLIGFDRHKRDAGLDARRRGYVTRGGPF
jgi:formate hydrogenlyase subunit 3/multisubunit Na+/H+ antiporter MnhD subunit